MPEPARKPATYEDILAAPEHLVAEIVDGELHLNPRPAGTHAEAAAVLGMDIGSAFHRGRGGPGGWLILFEPELHLGPSVFVPDLAGWKRERLPSVSREPAIQMAPDWACEILSPSTALVDRRRKMPIYAESRVTHLWLVDPVVRSLEIYQLEDSGYLHLGTYGEDDRVRVAPFDAIELDLAALWPNTVTPLPDAHR